VKILLDTHFVLATAGQILKDRAPDLCLLLQRDDVDAWVSVASLWEIAIKTRLGKLAPPAPLTDLENILTTGDVAVAPVETRHAFAVVHPEPATRDPFDRLLLGVCATEGMRLATLDRALTDHPLAFRL
jgi:PIN domain nuclease of toxin-antitoxin system